MFDPFQDNDFTLSGKHLPPDSISLTPEDIEWALHLSESMPTPAQQWQLYINLLARIGTEQWLQKRVPAIIQATSETKLNSNSKALNHPDSTCLLPVGEVTLVLLATEMLYEPIVPLPKSMTAPLGQHNHFYIWVEVLEELEAVTVKGYLLEVNQGAIATLPLEPDDTYLLPMDWFVLNPDQLLLHLRSSTLTESRQQETASPFEDLQHQVINVQQWLTNQLDQVSQTLSWVLLPPLSPSLGFRPVRSPIEEFNELMTELVNHYGLTLPPEARGAYRDFQWEAFALRLYVVTWRLPLTETLPEWALLLVLSGQPGTTLQPGIKLQVRDEHQILEEPVLTNASQPYLYAQVIGHLNEQFWVTMSWGNGAAITLPPFTFAG